MDEPLPEAWMALKEPEHLVIPWEKAGFREGRVVREDIGYYIGRCVIWP